MEVSFIGLGWRVKLQKRRTSYFLTLVREIVLGNGLKQGDELFYYLVDANGRKGVLVFLDGKDRLEATASKTGT